MKNHWIITILIAIIVAAGAFFGGMKYQQSQAATRSFANGMFIRNGQGGSGTNSRLGGRTGNFGGVTVGDVVSVDADSMTIKLQDGSSKIVNLSSSTTYNKTDTASKSDLKAGEHVAAIGTTNSDGSITAQNVQLNPMFRMNRPGQG